MGLFDRISLKQDADVPPESIEVGDRGELVVQWPGGARASISALRLREACPCAGCVEEGTGRKILDPATIPGDVHPLAVKAVGNYAIQIEWSDGHSTGIYSWHALRQASARPPG